MSDKPPERGADHDRLEMFLGEWRAEGRSYGGPKQRADDPRSAAESWTSTHTGRWHTGKFFLVQDERAIVGGNTFDTLSVMGVDLQSGRYFARSFENHGFYRHYEVTAEGRSWTMTGELERARLEFTDDGRTQTITWEWKPKDAWLPLCERVARRLDSSTSACARNEVAGALVRGAGDRG
jgi:hypothetical protein